MLLCMAAALHAQQDRVVNRIDRSRKVVLQGNIHPKARPEFDQGVLDPTTPTKGMTLILKQSTAQQADMQQLLADQQNPSSPNYHKWLTPELYAARFGLSQSDLDKINAWLQSEGFSVDNVARARNYVTFSGTAGQVKTSLGAELHRYAVNGETHFANATAPSIPADLQGIVAGIRGLNDFHPVSRLRTHPEYNTGSGVHHIVPDDLATIYNIAPLYQAKVDGTGQTIVVVGQTSVGISDIQKFRTKFNLTAPNVQTKLVPNHPDPGVSSGDLPEADLDIEWSGAVARNATIYYVYSADAFDAVQYAVDNNLGTVVSMSYGMCEPMDLVDLPLTQAVAQQANSQGITWMAASGDTGAADCEDPNASLAQAGLAVDVPGVVPEVTSVGGTQFNENGGSFWRSTNDANSASALSYIPEAAWNETSPTNGLGAGGGGISSFFPRPSWQNGPGMPIGAYRLVPDVSFSASSAHDAYYVYSGGSVSYYGGTSVPTPVFAGIVALLNQYLVSTGAQSTPGLGNINPALYHLAQTTSGVFHDILAGNNLIPCNAGAPNCSNGNLGYNAGTGYDMATGLGSVDAYNFVHQWSSSPAANSAIVASIDQTPVYQTPVDKNGFQWSFNLSLTEEAGIGTTLTSFTADGVDYTSQIASLFGSATIPARGSISAFLGFKTLTVPKTVVFTFGGVDASGNLWSQQLSAPFTSAQVTNYINGISNAASGQQVYAPGMIMSVYGVQMGIGQPTSASATPLPSFMAGISAYVNNVPAPLYYVSPTQVNIQIPYETQPGTATLEIDTPYQIATMPFTVAAAGPGIFMLGDGSVNPSKSGSRGGTYTLYITGEGQVTPSVTTGSTPSPRGTPKPRLAVSMTIGGVDAPITFIGIPSWSVGVTQINFTVPASVPVGKQQVVVTVGTAASAPATFTVQ